MMFITSTPFLAIGIWLTLARLKSIGLPRTLCLIFFVPVINLIFFTALSIIPSGQAKALSGQVPLDSDKWIPKSAAGSALASIGIAVPIGFALAILAVQTFQNYGWGLFVGLPFAMGLISVLIYNARDKRGYWASISVALFSIFIVGFVMFGLAAEGAICLVMAAPIGLTLAFFGGSVGYLIVYSREPGLSPKTTALIFLC